MFGVKAIGLGSSRRWSGRLFQTRTAPAAENGRSLNVVLARGPTRVMKSEDRNARRLMALLMGYLQDMAASVL